MLQIPNVKLGGMGPNMDLTLRRSTLAGDDMWKAALKQPVTYVANIIMFLLLIYIDVFKIIQCRAKIKKVKNISVTSMGDKVGRIHMKRQDLNNMGGRRMNVLRSTSGGKKRRERDDGPAITEDPDSGRARGKRTRSR